MRTSPIERGLPVDARKALAVVADRRGETMSNLPRLIGKSDGYLARYIRDGVPLALPASLLRSVDGGAGDYRRVRRRA